MPDLEAHVWQPFRDRGVLVYGLHGDEPQPSLEAFLEQTGITFPVVHSRYTILDIDFPQAGYPFPRQVVVDKNRVIRSIRNDLDIPGLVDEIERLLVEPR